MDTDHYASRLPFKVIAIKSNGHRVLFSRHRTRRAADELVACLANAGCLAEVDVDACGEDQAQPGETVSK